MNIYILIIIGYFIGNINTAYIIGHFKNVDIRKVGSKNPGASNVTMSIGWRYGILTGILDILKAFTPVLVLHLLHYSDFVLVSVGTAVIAGHVYPIIHLFKGGKGTASFVGFALAFNPIFGLVLSAIIVLGTILTDFIAIGTMLMMVGYVIGGYFLLDQNTFLVSLIVPLVSIYKHIPNMIKIYKKEEQGLRQTFKKEKS